MRSMTQLTVHYRDQSEKRCMHHDRFQLEVIHMYKGHMYLSCTVRSETRAANNSDFGEMNL